MLGSSLPSRPVAVRRAVCRALVCVLSILSGSIHAASVLPLSVAADPGVRNEAVPLVGGVPFARGEFRDAGSVRLLAGGAEASLQAEPLATWPDGSVKWLLLSFVARTNQELRLEYGAGVRRADVPKPLTVQSGDGGALTVDTGLIRFRVRRDGPAFLDELWLDRNGNGAYEDDEKMLAPAVGGRANFMDFVHLASASDYRVLSRAIAGDPDASRVEIDELKIESAGPIRGVVLLRGKYHYRALGSTIPNVNSRGACPFTLRLTAYRGLGIVEAEHFFVYEGDPDYDFLRHAGLAVYPRLDRSAARVRTLTAGGTETIPLSGAAYIGLAQNNADHYRLWKAADVGAADVTVAEGRRFEGGLDLGDDRWGVTVGHRRLWQNYPNGFEVDAAAGGVTAAFWPLEANVLDFRRYSREWGVGETGAGAGAAIATQSRFAAKGCGKTHSMVFVFHGAGVKEADLLSSVRALDAKALVRCEPARYADTGALGRYSTPAAGAFLEIEQYMSRTFDLLLDSQERYRWYGFFSYGCIQSMYNRIHKLGRWDCDFGRWGWAGNDGAGRLNHAFLLQYLRTGDRRYFDEGEASVLNNYDVWMVHTPEYFWDFNFATARDVRGLVHRHNVQPFGCPYVGARGAYPVGMKIYYYLTGSGRARDGLDEVLSAAVEYLDGKGWRLGHSGGVDGFGTAAQSLLCAWERTGDAKYRDYLLKFLRDDKSFKPSSPWEASMTTAFGLFHAATEYHDLVGDPQIVANIEAMARLCNTAEVKKNFTYPGGYFRIFADAYRLTGKEEFAQACRAAVDKERESTKGSAQMVVPPADWPAPVAGPEVNLDGNSLRDLPYVFEALRRGAPASPKE